MSTKRDLYAGMMLAAIVLIVCIMIGVSVFRHPQGVPPGVRSIDCISGKVALRIDGYDMLWELTPDGKPVPCTPGPGLKEE